MILQKEIKSQTEKFTISPVRVSQHGVYVLIKIVLENP